MDFLTNQWLPIVVSGVIVFVLSFVMHTVLPHHKGEYKQLPNEVATLESIKDAEPGQYMYPWCGSMAEMRDPSFVQKQQSGPNGVLTIWPGPVNMGRNLGISFTFYLVVGIFLAYVGSQSVGATGDYMDRFQLFGAMAFMAHGLGWIPNMIWFGSKGFWTYSFDSIVYALATAGTFAWLWKM